MRELCVRFSWVLLCLILILPAAAQDSGRIVGSVTDSSGAMAPGVSVRVINTQNNAAAKYVANDQGRFTADNLSPGTYIVEADAPGFKHFVQSGITVRVGDAIDVSIQLELGSATETVTVTGEVALLQTANSST